MSLSLVDRIRNESEVGVPRRFSIRTIFVLLTLYAVLFRMLVLLGAPANWTGLICMFFGIITISQMILFRGVRPRAASIVAGMSACPVMLIVVTIDELTTKWTGWTPIEGRLDRVGAFASALLLLAMVGLALGYMVGGSTAGVFYVLGKILPKSTIAGVEVSGESKSTDSLPNRWALAIGKWLNPVQPRTPLRGAIAIFSITIIFGILVSPFVLWAAQHHVIMFAVAVGICLAIWSGNFQLWVYWPMALGTIGAFVGGYTGHHLKEIQFVQSTFRQDPDAAVIFVRNVGAIVGFTASALAGWCQWAIYRKQANRSFGVLHLLGFAALILAIGALASNLAAAWVQSPIQQLYSEIHARGGYVYWDASLSPRSVSLTEKFGDEEFSMLRPFLSNCWDVSLTGPGFTNRSVKALDGLNVNTISLARALVTDEAFEGLQDFGASNIFLRSVDVGDLAIADLIANRQIPAVLESLYLTDTKITDDGLAQLKACRSLRFLALDSCKITDAGLANLAGCTKLERVSLSQCPITDDGLQTLVKAVPSLRSVYLDNTAVTDIGLMHLAKAMVLREIRVKGTKVTPAGVERFRQAMPGCGIQWDDPSEQD